MPFVIDASVTACWLLPDETHPAATTAYEKLKLDYALVPRIWWFEICNLLIVNERRGRLGLGQANRALELLGRLPIEFDQQIDEAALLGLARAHRLTVYDAAYLELAQRQRAPLATLDNALASAARAAGIGLLAS